MSRDAREWHQTVPHRPGSKLALLSVRRLSLFVCAGLIVISLVPASALANTVRYTLHGTRSVVTPATQTWLLRNNAHQTLSIAGLACVVSRTNCSWHFSFRTGAFEVVTRNLHVRAGRTVTGGISDATGAFGGDRGSVRISFITARSAKFAFVLRR